MIFGLGAAIIGMALYAGFEILTGWIIGYVSLAVGYLVGKAMMKGSHGTGGRHFQIAAAVLTYLAVSLAQALVILQHVYKMRGGLHISASGWGTLFFYGIASPVLDLKANLFQGLIGIFVLTIGIRIAWRITAATPLQVTGPYPVAV